MRAQKRRRAEISIAPHDPLGHWLQLVDATGMTYGCVLSTDPVEPRRYVLEFDVAVAGGSPPGIGRLEVSLSTASAEPLSVAAALWQRYRTADVGEAVSAFEMSMLEQMVRHKLASPLAATVASLILRRGNRLDLLHDWVRNLANWFEVWPDGNALWAEQLMRQQPRGSEAALAEASEYLTRLLQRGLPHTSEGLAYAARLCATLTRLGSRVPAHFHAPLQQLGSHLQTALSFFRPGGLCTTYAGFALHTDPTTFLGPFTARR